MNTYLWVAILFGITITGYLMGYEPIFFEQMAKYDTDTPLYESIPLTITGYLGIWDGILTVGGAVVTGVLLGGLNLLVLIPFVLASIMINMMVFPTSYITQAGLPPEVSLIITVFLNVTTFMVLIGFIRNG